MHGLWVWFLRDQYENVCTHYYKLLWIRASTKMEEEWIRHFSFHRNKLQKYFKKLENIYQVIVFFIPQVLSVTFFVQVIIRLFQINWPTGPFTSPVLADQYRGLQHGTPKLLPSVMEPVTDWKLQTGLVWHDVPLCLWGEQSVFFGRCTACNKGGLMCQKPSGYRKCFEVYYWPFKAASEGYLPRLLAKPEEESSHLIAPRGRAEGWPQ
jgi:hypothetical protein